MGESLGGTSRKVVSFGHAECAECSGKRIPVLKKTHLATRQRNRHSIQNPDYEGRRKAHFGELGAFSALRRINLKHGLNGINRLNVPRTKRKNTRERKAKLREIELIQEDLRLDGKAEVERLGSGDENLDTNAVRAIELDLEDLPNGEELLGVLSRWTAVFRKEGILKSHETVLEVFGGAMLLQKMKDSGRGRIWFVDLEQELHYSRFRSWSRR